VTGASQGIGFAIANTFAREGCALHLVARDRDTLHAVAKDIKDQYGVAVCVHAVDLSQRGSAADVAARCSTADIVINNAGNTPRGDIVSLDEATWREGWELKVFGYINLTREFYRLMRERADGVIINIIGIGAEKYDYGYVAGGTGNAALAAMTRIVGSASLDYGVRVLGVHPGWVDTAKARRSLVRRATVELGDGERWLELIKDLPGRRLIQPQQVADVVAFLASSRANAMSGTIVTVDAGFATRGYPHLAELSHQKGRE
jgi:NAD(P)-dependent dehydrogenase (short-subunit alcohol dehydrogenase family)